MDKRGNPLHIRLPLRLEYLIREYAKKKGLRLNDAIIHLVAKGFSIEKWKDDFHIDEFTENYFEKE